jgi:acyl carrier protein
MWGKRKMTTELEILQDYVRRETGYDGELAPDVDLLERHILDSFSIVQLAMFIQEHFGIELEAEDLVRDNLSTLSSAIALVNKKKAASVEQGEQRT